MQKPAETQQTPKELFLAHLDLIDRAALSACRRRRLGQAESEDFVSLVHVKLVENDYAVIRRFRGKCKLSTYLVTVVNRAFLDYLDHLYGKWRPSAEAKRQGSLAIELDRLITRDGFTFDEACQMLTTRREVTAGWRDLEAIAARLPSRAGRRIEGEEVLHRQPAPDGRPDVHALDRERRERWQRICAEVAAALAGLPAEDRLIIRMRCDHTVAEIARSQGREQKPLYRHIQGLYRTLREELERRGVAQEEVSEMVSQGGLR